MYFADGLDDGTLHYKAATVSRDRSKKCQPTAVATGTSWKLVPAVVSFQHGVLMDDDSVGNDSSGREGSGGTVLRSTSSTNHQNGSVCALELLMNLMLLLSCLIP